MLRRGPQDDKDFNSNILPPSSNSETVDPDDLLGAARDSDGAPDPGLLNSTRESIESRSVASIQSELAALSVSQDTSGNTGVLEEASSTQSKGKHPQKKKIRLSLSAGQKPLAIVRPWQGGVSSSGTARDSSTPRAAVHVMSDSEEDMAVPEETPMELVSTASPSTLVVTVASSGDESDSGRTVELT